MPTVKAAELVLDFDLYPRSNIDGKHVADIAAAMQNGVELPPVLADRATKRVADGFHRVRAHINTYGAETLIAVTWKTYKDDAALFLDAMRYNAQHGLKMDTCDKTRAILIAERLHIDMEAVSGALHVDMDLIGKLRTTRTATFRGVTLPLKRTIKHKAGMNLTTRQVEANTKLSGMNQVFYCNQLIELIESDLLDTANEILIERLRKLHELLDGVLVAK